MYLPNNRVKNDAKKPRASYPKRYGTTGDRGQEEIGVSVKIISNMMIVLH